MICRSTRPTSARSLSLSRLRSPPIARQVARSPRSEALNLSASCIEMRAASRSGTPHSSMVLAIFDWRGRIPSRTGPGIIGVRRRFSRSVAALAIALDGTFEHATPRASRSASLPSSDYSRTATGGFSECNVEVSRTHTVPTEGPFRCTSQVPDDLGASRALNGLHGFTLTQQTITRREPRSSGERPPLSTPPRSARSDDASGTLHASPTSRSWTATGQCAPARRENAEASATGEWQPCLDAARSHFQLKQREPMIAGYLGFGLRHRRWL